MSSLSHPKYQRQRIVKYAQSFLTLRQMLLQVALPPHPTPFSTSTLSALSDLLLTEKLL